MEHNYSTEYRCTVPHYSTAPPTTPLHCTHYTSAPCTTPLHCTHYTSAPLLHFTSLHPHYYTVLHCIHTTPRHFIASPLLDGTSLHPNYSTAPQCLCIALQSTYPTLNAISLYSMVQCYSLHCISQHFTSPGLPSTVQS